MVVVEKQRLNPRNLGDESYISAALIITAKKMELWVLLVAKASGFVTKELISNPS